MNNRSICSLPSFPSKRKKRVAFSLVLICGTAFLGTPAQAADKYMIWYPDYSYFDGTSYIQVHSPDWNITYNWNDEDSVPSAWSDPEVPVAGDNAYILNGYQTFYNFDYPGATPLGSLNIDNNSSMLQTAPYFLAISGDLNVGGSSTGAFTQTGGNLVVGGWMRIGDGGTGSFRQAGGNVDLTGPSADLYIGKESSGVGNYVLETGNLNTGWQYVGWYGTGTFQQTGGSNTAWHELNVGTENGSQGTYTLSGGNLYLLGTSEDNGIFIGRSPGSNGFFYHEGGDISAFNMVVGDQGNGSFTQTGGTNTITGQKLLLGAAAGSTGSYSLSGLGSSVEAPSIIVGAEGKGTFTQDVDSAVSTGTLALGYNVGGDGAYILESGNLSTDFERIGMEGSGTFTQNGGTNTVATRLSIGQEVGSNGTYTFTNGTLNAARIWVGPGGAGTFQQQSGSVTVSTDLVLGGVQVGGVSLPGEGWYAMDGGNLAVENDLIAGNRNKGRFDQSGGTVHVTNNLSIGKYLDTTGEYTLSGPGSSLFVGGILAVGDNGTGTFNLEDGRVEAYYTAISRGGQGTFTQAGGTFISGNVLAVGDGGSGEGVYDLQEGVFDVNSVRVGRQGLGNFYQSGGAATVNYLNLGGQRVTLPDGTIQDYMGNGTYALEGGTLEVQSNLNIGNVGTGVFNLRDGGNLRVEGTINVGVQDGTGTLNYSGGDLTADIINNAGSTVNLSGGDTRVVNGNVTNNGTFKVTDTTVSYTGTFTNAGEYNSDPSNNFFTDLFIEATGFLQGGEGDLFSISGSFLNFSTNGDWDTAKANLEFTGAGMHDFQMGPAGSVFGWDSFTLGEGVQLNLLGGELRVGAFHGFDPGDLLGFGTIHFDIENEANSYLLTTFCDGTIELNTPGPVPEPATMVLFGTGLVGLVSVARRKKTA